MRVPSDMMRPAVTTIARGHAVDQVVHVSTALAGSEAAEERRHA